jgi:hypothetical protein
MRSSILKGLAFAAVIIVGCSFSPEKNGGNGNPGTGGAPVITGISGSGNLATGGQGNETLDGGNFCGQTNRPLVALPPDVLILLDRSGSMDNDINDRGCSTTDGGMMGNPQGMCGLNSKWGIMTPAIKQVVSATETTVNWGLKYFADPGNSGCNVNNTAAVNIAMMNATAVNNSITMQTNAQGGISNGSRTPTRAGITGAVAYLNGRTEQNPRFILLATDGLPNCKQGAQDTADDSMAAVQAVQTAFTNGIPTFVVGIATSGMGTADATLNMMAMAGGYANPGATSYYSVDSQQALIDALNSIITKVGGECRFPLGKLPSNDGRTSYDAITVFADGTPVPRDATHTDGWDYADTSHTSIQLTGSICERVMNGEIQQVTVAFMCIEP